MELANTIVSSVGGVLNLVILVLLVLLLKRTGALADAAGAVKSVGRKAKSTVSRDGDPDDGADDDRDDD